MRIVIISAVAKNGVIGRSNGEMPWHSKEEFAHFKSTTFGHPIIMGRKSFEALGKPLKGRLNIILTKRGFDPGFEEVKVLPGLKEAYKFCEKDNNHTVFVIGGGQIYEQAMETADEMLISIMNFEAEGDVYFPAIDEDSWEIESRDKRNEFEILKYVRRKDARK